MPDGAELILSKSSIDVWFDCERKWLYAYTYRIPGAPNLDMAVGTAVHAGVETWWRIANGNQPFKDSPAADAELSARRALAREVALGPTPDEDAAAGAIRDVLTLLRTYLDNIAPTFNPTIIERDFLIRVNGVLVSGRIDAADEDVHDTKTTSTPSKVNAESMQLGMTIYRHGFKSITGRFPGKLQLDIVGKNGRWAQKEIKPDDAGMAEVVGLVAKGIAAGEFKPTGAAKGECYRCPYATLCPFALLTPAVESTVLESSPSLVEVPSA